MLKISKTSFAALLFLLFSGLISSLQAQTPDYQYEDFRFTDIDRKALELQTSVYASDFSLFELNSRSQGAMGSFDVAYSRFRNLEKTQAYEQYSIGGGLSRIRINSNAAQNTIDYRASQLQGNLQAYREYRHYYKPNRFYEYRLYGQTNYNNIRGNDYTLNTRTFLQTGTVSGSVGIFTGWGRLEPIDDVFLAKFTLDEMQSKGLISDEITQEQLFSLGQRMAFIRNQRVYNFRRQRVYELEQLDAWFKENTEIDQTSTAFFAILNDKWLYGFDNTRFTGWRISFGLEPGFESYQHLNPVNYGMTQLNYTLAGVAEHHRPINQFWQRSSQLSTGVNHLFYHTYASGIRLMFEPFLQASTGWSWYPNTRTRISSHGMLNYIPTIDPENSSPPYDHGFISSFQLDAEYFFNFQMRISGFIQLNQTFDFPSFFFMNSGIRFTYNIF